MKKYLKIVISLIGWYMLYKFVTTLSFIYVLSWLVTFEVQEYIQEQDEN
jgi:hypothetical protein